MFSILIFVLFLDFPNSEISPSNPNASKYLKTVFLWVYGLACSSCAMRLLILTIEICAGSGRRAGH
jgi:hypothetical protein